MSSATLQRPDYATGTEADHFAQFCHDHLVQSIDQWDGLPLDLEPFQHRFLSEALSYDEHGLPVWTSVVLVLPRKNGKTALLAAYALYRLLLQEGSPEILLAAASDKQAGRLFNYAASFVRQSPLLKSRLRIRDYIGEIAREDGRGVILRMASDPDKLHGYSPSLVVADELAQWQTHRLRRAFAALVSGGGARSAPQVFTITVAGEAQWRDDSILGRMLDRAEQADDKEREPGLLIGRIWDAQMLVWNYSAPTNDPTDTANMKLANPASWITEAYLAKAASNPELTQAEVLQLHGCVWAAGADTWLPAGTWRKLASPRPIEPGERVVLAFDGSYNNDSTALIGCSVEDRYLFNVRTWEKPPGDEPWRVPVLEVIEAVAQAFDEWTIVEMACDPPGWRREIEEWAQQYGEPPVVWFETNKLSVMAPACSRFYSAVVQETIRHDGSDVIARHLANAHKKETPNGAYITKERRSSPRKIDAAVASVVAYHRASFHSQQTEVWAAGW